eukprot:scaffold29926_cov69-Phaeocystis_antarctica.AAC.8
MGQSARSQGTNADGATRLSRCRWVEAKTDCNQSGPCSDGNLAVGKIEAQLLKGCARQSMYANPRYRNKSSRQSLRTRRIQAETRKMLGCPCALPRPPRAMCAVPKTQFYRASGGGVISHNTPARTANQITTGRGEGSLKLIEISTKYALATLDCTLYR